MSAEVGSAMERFIRAFLTLDKNDDEAVSKNELEDYCRRNRMDPSLVDKWMHILDADKSGKISLSEFCRGFGLKIDEMRMERSELAKAAKGDVPKVPEDVHVIASTMPEAKQVEVAQMFKDIVKKFNTETEMPNVAKQLKENLEQKYGRVWQVVIVAGSYWMNFSHEPFQSIQFKYDKHICLVWRTPSN